MQFWEKLGPAAKIAGILAILAGLLLVLRPGDEPVAVQIVETPQTETPTEDAEEVVAAEPKPAEEVVEEIAEAEGDESTAAEEVAEETLADDPDVNVPAGAEGAAEATEPEEATTPEVPTETVETKELTAEDETVAKTASEPEPATTPEPIEPAFDVVRIAPDGNSLVAGQAEPGSTIVVLMAGEAMTEVTADAQGKFVAFFDLPPSTAARALTLSTTLADGTSVASNDIVFVQPNQVATPEPQVAVVEDAPASELEQSTEEAAETADAAGPAPSSPTVVVATDEGIEVLQSGADTDPALQDSVMIEVISYSEAGDVELGGRAAAGSYVRLYLDNAPIGGARVDSSGKWAGTFTDIDPGRYTLRADMVADDGKVASRFETPFQRVDRQIVTAMLEGAEEDEKAEVEVAEDAAPEAAEAEMSEETTDVVEANEETVVPLAEEVVQASEPAPGAPEPVAAAPEVSEPAVAEAPEPVMPSGPISVTVQPGNTLWAIAEANYGDGLKYIEVFQANRDKIRNPDLIYPGQIFDVPPKN